MMKKQVRAVDQTAYPHVLWPLRWTIAHNTWMVLNQRSPAVEVYCESLFGTEFDTHTPGLYGYKTIRVEVVRYDWPGKRMDGIA